MISSTVNGCCSEERGIRKYGINIDALRGKGTANCYFGSVASSRAPLIGHVANLFVGGQWPRRQGAVPGKFQRSTFATPIKPRITCRAVHDPHKLLGLELLCVLPRSPFMDNFRIADQQGRMRRVASRPGSTVALVANESINQHFKSPAENFCRW